MEEHLNKLTELVPVGMFRTDSTGGCVYANEKWCQLTGLSRDEALGDGWVRALHRDDRARIRQKWEEAVARAGAFVADFRVLRPDGHVIHVSGSALPLFHDDGTVLGYLGANWDISERQRAEDALRQLTHELQERIKELNCLYGISHIVERAGSSLETILQETANLLPSSWGHSGITCARVLIGDQEFRSDNFRESLWRQTTDINVHGNLAGFVEVSYLEERPTRDEGPFLAKERTLIDAVAERLGHVTERLQAERFGRQREDELRERLAHLTRVSTMGELASSIAHEVNQPLTAIATFAQACRRMIEGGTTDSPEVVTILRRISEEALRAGGIIHRLKDLVRKRKGERIECDLNELVRDVEHLASVDARLHDVALHLDLSPSLPDVLADGVQIQQVILNLIRNAVDAIGELDTCFREIGVRTSLAASHAVQVSVTDSGSGLSEEAETQLFQPFFTTKDSGLGIGLAISRSIVTSHGGRIWFSRNRDRGTTFYFTLPSAIEDNHGAS